MKYVIEVRRGRVSVTQGYATICINGIEITTFRDEIGIVKDGQKWYGDKIGGWASTTPDEAFIKGMLFHPFDETFGYSLKFRNMLDQAIRAQKVALGRWE